MAIRSHLLAVAVFATTACLIAREARGQIDSSQSRISFEGLEAAMRAILEKSRSPSVAAVVIVDGQMLWHSALGFADLEHQRPATVSTAYSLASITKTYTATALLRLLEATEYGLDAPIGALVSWRGLRQAGATADQVTLRRVAVHTAGLPRFWRFHYSGIEPPPRGPQVALDQYGFLSVAPGTRSRYSNLGYSALQLAMEKIAGKPFGEILEDEVFEPLGLKHTFLAETEEDVIEAAVPYDRAGRPLPFYAVDHPAASHVYASVLDLARFGQAHLRPQDFDRFALTRESRAAMQNLQNGVPGDFAVGWIIDSERGLRRLTMGGYSPGVSSGLYLYPERDLLIAVVCNAAPRRPLSPVDDVRNAILDVLGIPLPADSNEDRRASVQDNVSKLVGRWSGSVRTSRGEVPLRLSIGRAAQVSAVLGDRRLEMTRVNLEAEGLYGFLPGPLPDPVAERHEHRIIIELVLEGEALRGEATTWTDNIPEYYRLPFRVTLTRREE